MAKVNFKAVYNGTLAAGTPTLIPLYANHDGSTITIGASDIITVIGLQAAHNTGLVSVYFSAAGAIASDADIIFASQDSGDGVTSVSEVQNFSSVMDIPEDTANTAGFKLYTIGAAGDATIIVYGWIKQP